MKRTRRNPQLLIINPSGEKARRAWRALRTRYPNDIGKAIKEYKRRFSCNPVDYSRHPDFIKAKALFRKFHGVDPERVSIIDVPQLGESKEPIFLTALGGAVSESYMTAKRFPRSKKGNSIWVHKYESPESKLPLKVVTADGKLIMTLPGKHRVKDFIYG